MDEFRYDTSGQWYKGNTHMHSTASDGGCTFGELAAQYAAAGYSFLFRTDHWVVSDVAADTASYPLLWLDGVELDGRDEQGVDWHVVCLGRVAGLSREMGFRAALRSAREQGALTIAAHPHWTGNSTGDCARLSPDGVEVYNHVCHWLNGKSGGLPHWEAMLRVNPAALAFAADDAHLRPEHPSWNGGWIVVNAKQLSSAAVMDAIRRGNYYSSCGPAFEALSFDGETVRVRTSPVQFMRLVGPAWCGERRGGFGAPAISEASFLIPRSWPWAYLEIEDAAGRRAWTNTLLVPHAPPSP